MTRSNDNQPWPYGFNVDEASEKAKAAWRYLSDKQKLELSRHNPFKNERYKAIRSLKERGLTTSILKELSGLSIGSINSILYRRRKDEQEK